jgi:hypothetical protein
MLFRISLRLIALYPEKVEEQVEGGNYPKISRDYLKGAKKRQRVRMKLRRRQTKMVENAYLKVVEGQPISKLLESYLVHREYPSSLETLTHPVAPSGDHNLPIVTTRILDRREQIRGPFG